MPPWSFVPTARHWKIVWTSWRAKRASQWTSKTAKRCCASSKVALAPSICPDGEWMRWTSDFLSSFENSLGVIWPVKSRWMPSKQSWSMRMAAEKSISNDMLVSKKYLFHSFIFRIDSPPFLRNRLDPRWFDRRFVLVERCDAQQRRRAPKDETVCNDRFSLLCVIYSFSRIENPRIVLLDCSLEYKKGESQTSLEFSGEPDFTYANRHRRALRTNITDRFV